MNIQLSEHFTYSKLLRFTLPSIAMMIFTSVYGVVDGIFVSNFAGKTAFAAINLIMPYLMVFGTLGFMVGTGGTALISMTLRAFRIYCLSFLLCGFNIFSSSFFTALNNGLISALISFLRTLVLQISAVMLLPLVWELDGIWCSVVVAESGALILSGFFLVKYRSRYRYY